MAKSHYEVLGVRVSSTTDEIRSAYRKIVLQHHPDRSSDPKSADIFMSATSAYEVLSDTNRRKQYDEVQRLERIKVEQERQAPTQKRGGGQDRGRPQPSPRPPAPREKVDGPAVPTGTAPKTEANFSTTGPRGSTTVEVTRLTMLFTRGQHMEAERLARKIIERDGRQPIPYAVLGDLHRQRGELQQASKMYAFAVQMDPRNQLYQQRYEELLATVDRPQRKEADPTTAQLAAPIVGGSMVLLAACYLAITTEAPILPGFQLLSTWTVGLLVMLFLSGVFLGATFSVGQFLDRFSSVTTSTLGKLNPSLALAAVALVNFWAAALMYVALGIGQGSFNFSTTRLVSAVSAATIVFSLAAGISHVLSGWQTLLWGGNIVYIGGICGWYVADSFRR